MPSKNEVDEQQKLIWEIGIRLYGTVFSSIFTRDVHAWQSLDELMAWTEGKPKIKS